MSSQRWYLASDGGLTVAPPTAASKDTYTVDNTASTGDATRWQTNLTGGDVYYPDRAGEDAKLLTYTSEPLKAAVRVTGAPVVSLHVSSSLADGALHIYLEDVAPDGRVTYLTEGVLRLIHGDLRLSRGTVQAPGPGSLVPPSGRAAADPGCRRARRSAALLNVRAAQRGPSPPDRDRGTRCLNLCSVSEQCSTRPDGRPLPWPSVLSRAAGDGRMKRDQRVDGHFHRLDSGRRGLLFIPIAAAAVTLAGCGPGGVIGSGPTKVEARHVEPFTRVEVENGIVLAIHLGGPQALEVEAQENILGLVSTIVEGDVLKLRGAESFTTAVGVNVTASIPALAAISAHGGSQASIVGATDRLDIKLDGGARLVASGDCRSVSLVSAGGARADLTALITRAMTLNISGWGDGRRQRLGRIDG